MTTRNEFINSLLWTEQFLLTLLDARKTPRVPLEVRQTARRLLRHYPTKLDLLMLGLESGQGEEGKD